MRAWVSIGVAVLASISLALPGSDVAAAGTSARALRAEWAAVADVSVVQESSRRISYRGTWKAASHVNYLSGKARSARARGAKASLRFTGTAVAWVGPVGPSQGKARVYIDGTLVKTVNTRASTFRASRVLFTKSWARAGTHRITIVANGTAGHPKVSLDAFLVRSNPAPTATPAPTPAPTATPAPTPAPTNTPTGSVRVTTIPALLTALADNTVTEIVVANGTYRVSPASARRSDSLWIGARFAGRTRAVLVRAETRGGVTFDGGGATYFGGLTFVEGAHDQTWDGFRFANGLPTQTGVIVFGGYPGLAAPHHITLREIAIAGSITSTYAGSGDHSIYFSHAVGGPHDILVDGYTVDGSGGVNTALTFYHSDAPNQNAWNVTVRRLVVSGTNQAIELWDETLRNIRIDGATITNARQRAVRYELAGSGIVLANITSTGSGAGTGFYSSYGSNPPGVTFINNSFR